MNTVMSSDELEVYVVDTKPSLPTPPNDYRGLPEKFNAGEAILTQNLTTVSLKTDQLSASLKEFLVQMQKLLEEAPADMGSFALTELEISASINANGKLTLWGAADASAGLQAGMKFVFKKRT